MGVSFCSNQGGVTTEFPTLKGQPQQKAPPTTQTNKPKASKRGKEEVTALSVGSWLIDWIGFTPYLQYYSHITAVVADKHKFSFWSEY